MVIWPEKPEHCKVEKDKKWKKAIIKFEDFDIKKQKFHQHKRLISLKNIDNSKIVVSETVSFGKKGFKYFIGYKDEKIKPLYFCIFLYISHKNERI